MKKRVAICVVSALALLGLGSGLTPASAKPTAPVAPVTVNSTAGACTEVYILIRLGYCWRGLN
jgi:hypothetical protein